MLWSYMMLSSYIMPWSYIMLWSYMMLVSYIMPWVYIMLWSYMVLSSLHNAVVLHNNAVVLQHKMSCSYMMLSS